MNIPIEQFYLQQFLLDTYGELEKELEPELVDYIKHKQEEGWIPLYAKYGVAFLGCKGEGEIIVCTFKDGEISSILTSRNEMATAVAHWDMESKRRHNP